MAPRFRRIKTFFVAIGLVTTKSGFALTIQEVSVNVRNSNRDIAAAQKDVEAAEHGKSSVYAKYFPTIELKNTFTRLNKDVVIDIPPQRIERDFLGGRLSVGIEVDPPPVKVQDRDIPNSHLLLTQPIYAGGRITAANDAAAAAIDESKALVQKTADDRILEALTRYFQVSLAESSLKILSEMSGHMNRLLTIAEALVQKGITAKFSTMQIKVAQAELNARLAELNAKRELARLALQTSMSMQSSHHVTIETPLQFMPLDNGLDKFKTQALQVRQEFKILDAKDRQVEALQSAETGKMLPTVYAFGKKELITDRLTALQPEWAIGVGIDIPLTSGISQIPERRKAAAMRQKVEILKSKALNEIPLQVEAIYAQVIGAKGSLEALNEGLTAASESLRLAESRFNVGNASALEVLKSLTDLESVKIKQVLATEEYNRRLMELYHAAGGVNDYIDSYVAALKSHHK